MVTPSRVARSERRLNRCWLAPVRPGDTLRTTGEVLEVRPSSSKPDRGATTMAFSVANQDGVEVMRYKVVMIMRRKAS